MAVADPLKVAPRTLMLSERRRAERKYNRLVNKVLKELEKQLMALDSPTPQQIERALRRIAASPAFDRMCRAAAEQIVTMLAVGQKRTWRAAARASSKGRDIYRALMKETTNTGIGQAISAIVSRNAELIKSVPRDIAQQFSEMAKTMQFEGYRPDEVAKEMLRRVPDLRKSKAKLIARTESAKAATSLIEARAEHYNRPFYIWWDVHDERTRSAHRKMHGVICQWSDPPNPEAIAGEKRSYGNYHPGGIFNCRCIPLCVIAIEDIEFPAKCHVAGKITTVGSLKLFKDLYGLT